MAMRLADLFDRLSHVFDNTAKLAEEHAARLSPRFDRLKHEEELARARQAHTYARRAQANADRLRQRSAPHDQVSHPSTAAAA